MASDTSLSLMNELSFAFDMLPCCMVWKLTKAIFVALNQAFQIDMPIRTAATMHTPKMILLFFFISLIFSFVCSFIVVYFLKNRSISNERPSVRLAPVVVGELK